MNRNQDIDIKFEDGIKFREEVGIGVIVDVKV